MEDDNKLHFVKLPNKYRNDHYKNWFSIAVFRILMVTDSKPVQNIIEELKTDVLTSTRIRLSQECEDNFFKLSTKHELNKIDTFLFVCEHIEKHPVIYFEKTQLS